MKSLGEKCRLILKKRSSSSYNRRGQRTEIHSGLTPLVKHPDYTLLPRGKEVFLLLKYRMCLAIVAHLACLRSFIVAVFAASPVFRASSTRAGDAPPSLQMSDLFACSRRVLE